MKKIIALIMALALVMGLAITVSAASITINPNVSGGTTGGETYNAYLVFKATISGGNVAYTIVGEGTNKSQFFDVIQDYTYNGNKVFTLNEINETGEYNVLVDASFTGEDAAKDLADELKTVATNVTATNNTGKFTNLATGYYLVTDSLGSALVVDTLGDVTINTKNAYPSLTKKADKTTAAFGETVTYTVTVDVPATATGEIKVIDTMTNLTYVALAEGTTADVTATATTDNKTVTFTIPETVVAGNLDGTVTIKYTATVDAGKATANNEAYLTYSAFTSESVETSLANYKIDVYKYTGSETAKTGLAGAGFVLKNDEGKYYKLTNDIVSWVDAETDATEYKTAENNEYTVTFAGLANGEYTLVEKTVPAGYNKANDTPVKVENVDRTGDKQVAVLNNTGSELPSTGGIGTTLFYVIGGLLMTGAAVLLITKKRMSN